MTEEQLIKEYEAGKSISQLSRETIYTYGKIQKILRENNVTIRGGRKKKTLSTSQLKEFEQKFSDGVTLEELSELFGLHKQTLARIAKENGFERRNNNRINKRICSNYFSCIDKPEKAYWLGFLFADGSVDHYHASGRVRLQLQSQDQEILEKYKEALQLDCSLIYDKRERSQCVSVEFVDEQIYQDLVNFGIVPNKTYKCKHIPFEKVPKQFIPAFLLGLYDGDGCLTYSEDFSTDVTFGFTSYYETVVQDFQLEIDKLINKSEHNKNIFTSAWHTNWRGRVQILKILDILYENCPIHLERKYQKYLALKNSLD